MSERLKQILVISRRDLLIDVVSVYLEGLCPSMIEVADTSRKVEQFLAGSPVIDLVVIDDEKLVTAAGKTVADFLAPAIVVGKPGGGGPSGFRVIHLKPPVDLAAFGRAFQELSSVIGVQPREYCPVRLEVLVLLGKHLAQDLYKEKADGTFAVLFPRGTKLDLSDATFNDLARKRYLFVHARDFASFLRDFAAAIQGVALAGDEKVFELDERVSTTASVHELLATAIPELGLTPQLQAAVKASVDLAVSTLRKDPRLKDLIASLTELETSYRSWHSVALCYIACRLSSLMTWDSASTHYKLSLAAFLHDLKVTTPSLERVQTLEQLEASRASAAEKLSYREHPHLAAAIARQMKDFPGDVDHIVAQHHEMPNGSGFPLGLTHSKISPLASLFIVAHAITEELYEQQGAFSFRDSVARLEKVYYQGYFKKVLAALKELARKEAN